MSEPTFTNQDEFTTYVIRQKEYFRDMDAPFHIGFDQDGDPDDDWGLPVDCTNKEVKEQAAAFSKVFFKYYLKFPDFNQKVKKQKAVAVKKNKSHDVLHACHYCEREFEIRWLGKHIYKKHKDKVKTALGYLAKRQIIEYPFEIGRYYSCISCCYTNENENIVIRHIDKNPKCKEVYNSRLCSILNIEENVQRNFSQRINPEDIEVLPLELKPALEDAWKKKQKYEKVGEFLVHPSQWDTKRQHTEQTVISNSFVTSEEGELYYRRRAAEYQRKATMLETKVRLLEKREAKMKSDMLTFQQEIITYIQENQRKFLKRDMTRLVQIAEGHFDKEYIEEIQKLEASIGLTEVQTKPSRVKMSLIEGLLANLPEAISELRQIKEVGKKKSPTEELI